MIHAQANPEVSVVIPLFNERESLGPLWEELCRALAATGRSYEVVFVDDGSDDGSGAALAALRHGASQLRLLRLARHAGQTAALFAGFAAARGSVVVTLDADGQYDPADISCLLGKIPEFDAVLGYRAERRDSWVRRAASRIANAVRNAVSGDDIIDTCCTLKAFRRECLAQLQPFDGMHRFLPALVRMGGYRLCQLPVRHRPRRAGRSKYGIGNRAFRAFHDLLAVRWMKRRRLRYQVSEDP